MTKQMLENHTCVVGFYWRYGLNMPEFYEKMIKPAGGEKNGCCLVKKFVRKIANYFQNPATHLQCQGGFSEIFCQRLLELELTSKV